MVGLMVFVALGAGGIKANVVTMGGDQFRADDPEELRQRTQFFSYFYMAVNTGSFIANGYLVNLAFNPEVFSGGLVPFNYGYFCSYAIPLGFLTLAVLIFLMGTPRYTIHEPVGTPTTDFLRAFRNTVWRAGSEGKAVMLSLLALAVAAVLNITGSFLESPTVSEVLNILSMLLVIGACAAFIAT